MAASSSAAGILWVSLDPVRRVVDVYPRQMAHRIEAAYREQKPKCELGADYFNATVHFQPDGAYYQTTPGQHMGRSGYKTPGFRSVSRILQPAGEQTFMLRGRRVHGEWRLVGNEAEAEYTFTEVVPSEKMLETGNGLSEACQSRTWTADDLASNTPNVLNKSVVVWQWCRGTVEANGDSMRLGEEMWCPYMFEANRTIEAAFSGHCESAQVELEDKAVRIRFEPGSSFALQRDVADVTKERQVRRTLKTVRELRDMHHRMTNPNSTLSSEERVSQMAPGQTIPPHFFCPITQDLMSNPYRTADGHTYERAAIEHWLDTRDISPLTGLALNSVELKPNLELKREIDEWLAQHAAN